MDREIDEEGNLVRPWRTKATSGLNDGLGRSSTAAGIEMGNDVLIVELGVFHGEIIETRMFGSAEVV